MSHARFFTLMNVIFFSALLMHSHKVFLSESYTPHTARPQERRSQRTLKPQDSSAKLTPETIAAITTRIIQQPAQTPRPNGSYRAQRNITPPAHSKKDELPDFSETDSSSDGTEFSIEQNTAHLPAIALKPQPKPTTDTTTSNTKQLKLPIIATTARQINPNSSMSPRQKTTRCVTPRPDMGRSQQQLQEHLERARHHNLLQPINPMAGNKRSKPNGAQQ